MSSLTLDKEVDPWLPRVEPSCVLSVCALALTVAAAIGIRWAPPAAAQALTPVAFQLNFTAGGYNAGFALALQEGIYKKAGLDVTIIKGQGRASRRSSSRPARPTSRTPTPWR